ncbi:mevalonate kinase [Lentzea sp. NPDC006480]|uniref:mevalonate kinase n=1 Tax=Lentzea sp. NPDC006480 TaxID=3157176 RepID=UPI0033ACE3B1
MRLATRTGQLRGSTGVGRAHAKAILLGEHAVLYGSPALAMPVPALTVSARVERLADNGATTFLLAGSSGRTPIYAVGGLRQVVRTMIRDDQRLEVVLRGDIPIGRGLGSSAASARALVLALADLLDHDLDQRQVFDLVQIAENIAHGRASGVDALTTGARLPLLFENGTAGELHCGIDGVFVLADSGVASRTRNAVALVRSIFERETGARERFVSKVSGLVRSAAKDFAAGDADGLGSALTECHAVLRDLGLSTSLIDVMTEAAREAGALGAKISGGGLGGCLIALAGDPQRAEEVGRALRATGAVRIWCVPVGRWRHDC